MKIPFGQGLITALMDAMPNGLTVAELVPYYSNDRRPAQDVPEAVRRELGRQRIKLSFKGLALEYDNAGNSRTGSWTVYRIRPAAGAVVAPELPVAAKPTSEPGFRSMQWRVWPDFEGVGSVVSLPYITALADRVSA